MSVSATSEKSKPGAAPQTAATAWPVAYRRLWWLMVALVVLVGALCLWRSPVAARDWRDVALLTVLSFVVSLLPVRLPTRHLVTAQTIPIIFATVGLFGASAALLLTLVQSVTMVLAMPSPGYAFRLRNRLQSVLQVVSVQGIAIGVSALIYVTLESLRFPHSGVRPGEAPEWRSWLALPVCAIVAFLINAVLSTLLASQYFGRRWDILWHDNARWMLPSAFLMSPVGFLMAVLYAQHWWLGVGFIMLPIYALRMTVIYHERTLAAYKQGVELLGRVMQEAHPYTHGHLHRVARWAKKIAEDMKLPARSMQHIEDAAILHDIGKVAVDDRVLNKIGKLSDDDWAMIRRHPVMGADLVTHMKVLDKVAHWIRHHHERPDGKGYPDQLKGDEIPVESCIISVVDAFDAMVGGPAKEDQRPYRKPMSHEDAVAELRKHAGTQFHAGVVNVFIEILEREQEMEASGQHLAPQSSQAEDSLWVSPPTVGDLALPAGARG